MTAARRASSSPSPSPRPRRQAARSGSGVPAGDELGDGLRGGHADAEVGVLEAAPLRVERSPCRAPWRSAAEHGRARRAGPRRAASRAGSPRRSRSPRRPSASASAARTRNRGRGPCPTAPARSRRARWPRASGERGGADPRVPLRDELAHQTLAERAVRRRTARACAAPRAARRRSRVRRARPWPPAPPRASPIAPSARSACSATVSSGSRASGSSSSTAEASPSAPRPRAARARERGSSDAAAASEHRPELRALEAHRHPGRRPPVEARARAVEEGGARGRDVLQPGEGEEREALLAPTRRRVAGVVAAHGHAIDRLRKRVDHELRDRWRRARVADPAQGFGRPAAHPGVGVAERREQPIDGERVAARPSAKAAMRRTSTSGSFRRSTRAARAQGRPCGPRRALRAASPRGPGRGAAARALPRRRSARPRARAGAPASRCGLAAGEAAFFAARHGAGRPEATATAVSRPRGGAVASSDDYSEPAARGPAGRGDGDEVVAVRRARGEPPRRGSARARPSARRRRGAGRPRRRPASATATTGTPWRRCPILRGSTSTNAATRCPAAASARDQALPIGPAPQTTAAASRRAGRARAPRP